MVLLNTRIHSLLKKLEWSGTYEDGSGNRMGHPEDSSFYDACPECGGLKPKHKRSCELSALLRETEIG
jgi:hypothetical protein